MTLSMAVLLVPILVLVGAYAVLGGDPVHTVDPGPVYGQARAVARYEVRQPVGLEPGWRVVSAHLRRDGEAVTVRVGYVSPSDAGARVTQTDRAAEQVLPEELGGPVGRPTATVRLRGRSWQQYAPGAGRTALVLFDGPVTVVVIGDASPAELKTMAGSLR